MRSKAKASSVNNKTWDEVLARFDIQNQCDVDLLPEQGVTTHTRVEAHSSLMLGWTTRAILLVGCVVASPFKTMPVSAAHQEIICSAKTDDKGV